MLGSKIEKRENNLRRLDSILSANSEAVADPAIEESGDVFLSPMPTVVPVECQTENGLVKGMLTITQLLLIFESVFTLPSVHFNTSLDPT